MEPIGLDVHKNMADFQEVKIKDSSGNIWELESNGAMPINIQDQHSTAIDFFFRQVLNTITLSSTVTIDTYTCTLVAGHSVTVGDTLVFKEGTHFFQCQVLVVATNTITVDRPFDFAFTAAATGQRCNVNMAVDGSVTPVIFFITPANLSLDIDINAIIFHMEDNTAMDSSTFGGITALTRGVVVRSINGIHKCHFNVKSNGEFGHHCSLVEFDQKAPAGAYGIRAVKTFNGQNNDGVSIRLNSATSDQLQIIIQDNLTGLTEFHAVAHGHVVTN